MQTFCVCHAELFYPEVVYVLHMDTRQKVGSSCSTQTLIFTLEKAIRKNSHSITKKISFGRGIKEAEE